MKLWIVMIADHVLYAPIPRAGVEEAPARGRGTSFSAASRVDVQVRVPRKLHVLTPSSFEKVDPLLHNCLIWVLNAYKSGQERRGSVSI